MAGEKDKSREGEGLENPKVGIGWVLGQSTRQFNPENLTAICFRSTESYFFRYRWYCIKESDVPKSVYRDSYINVENNFPNDLTGVGGAPSQAHEVDGVRSRAQWRACSAGEAAEGAVAGAVDGFEVEVKVFMK